MDRDLQLGLHPCAQTQHFPFTHAANSVALYPRLTDSVPNTSVRKYITVTSERNYKAVWWHYGLLSRLVHHGDYQLGGALRARLTSQDRQQRR
jgi:hypothetical protein